MLRRRCRAVKASPPHCEPPHPTLSPWTGERDSGAEGFRRGRVPYLIPARMNDWTNCRWKIRNATRSGPEVMSVAAVMIDQSTPWSVEENTWSPTVSGREVTELVTISGQRKLFQWYEIETRA